MILRLHQRAARDCALSGQPEIVDCLVFVVAKAVVMREFGRNFAEMRSPYPASSRVAISR